MSKEYSLLFNEITDATSELSKIIKRLMVAQQRAEILFIEDEEDLLQ